MDPVPDLDPDPSIFAIDRQVSNKKLKKKSFSAYYFLKVRGTFSSFFKDKKSKRGHKTVPQESRLFLLFLLNERWTRIRRIRINNTAYGTHTFVCL
jgi:hypothetical protein